MQLLVDIQLSHLNIEVKNTIKIWNFRISIIKEQLVYG